MPDIKIFIALLLLSLVACQQVKQVVDSPEVFDSPKSENLSIYPEVKASVNYRVFEDYDNRIYLPLRLNSQQSLFLFDTGASTNVVDRSIGLPESDYLGQEYVGSIFDPVLSKSYRVQQLSVAGVELLPDIAYELDMGLIAAIDKNIKGILGVASLRSQLVYVTPASRQFHFLSELPESFVKHAHQFDLKMDASGRPTIEIEVLAGFTETLILDTGAQSSSLALESFNRLIAETGTRTVDTVFQGASGSYKTKSTWLATLPLAGFVHEDLMITQSASSLLGMDVLTRYNFIIDFRENALYLMKL